MDSYFRIKIIDRLIRNHKIVDDHYIWRGAKNNRGYGITSMFGKVRLVHRLSALMFSDLEIDSKIIVRHKCNNRLCFNPDHLLIKYIKDNKNKKIKD